MTVKTLGLTHSLDVLWSELVYTEARLLRDKVARDLAPLFVALLRRWEKIANGQRAVWRAEIVAQAGVDLQNLALDETVELIADALWLAEGKDRTTPRYRRYFAKPPSTVIRLGLENELPVVRDWVSSLTTEPELALRELGTRLEVDIAAGDLAIGERRDALTANRNHRLREINGLVHEINETRQSAFGLLLDRASKKKRKNAKEWAGGFFRKQPNERVAKAANAPERDAPVALIAADPHA